MKYIYTYLFICFILFGACKNSNASNSKSSSTDSVENKHDSLTIKLPDIPLLYTAPDQRAEYLANHYWDNFSFKDTSYIEKDITEQAWVDYLNILHMVPLNISQESIRSTIKKAEANKKMLNDFMRMADHYLYDPNSPMRNEELYIPVLETVIASDSLLNIEKIRPKDRLEMAYKNRVGTKALDFTYTLASGKQAKMYNLKTDYILLYFHNPGCHTCEETTLMMKNSLQINHLLSKKKITILTVYPDAELDDWKAHLSELSNNWINGYDQDMVIMYKKLYDLKAIPTLYLLDKNKVVILKDATFEMIEEYLRRLSL